MARKSVMMGGVTYRLAEVFRCRRGTSGGHVQLGGRSRAQTFSSVISGRVMGTMGAALRWKVVLPAEGAEISFGGLATGGLLVGGVCRRTRRHTKNAQGY